jgi:hypothetical protein
LLSQQRAVRDLHTPTLDSLAETCIPRKQIPGNPDFSHKGKEQKNMQRLHLPAFFCLIAALGSVALLTPPIATADPEGSHIGATYVTTVKDSSGNFVTRTVLTVHADHTMSVVAADQGGPTSFFTSQLGSWKPDGKGGVVGKTLDFDYPPNADVVRIDYTISFDSDHDQVTGTETLTSFPLQGNPLDGGGTSLGTFTFTGELVKP